MSDAPRPYAEAAQAYWRSGWANPIPVRGKFPPVEGLTGYDGRNVTWPDIQAWTTDEHAAWNVALRLPGDVIGIDVDAHGGKTGDEAMVRAAAQLGELPPTVRSTARPPWEASGIYLYRVPSGTDLRGAEKVFRKAFGDHVDIIRRDHRYAVVWPSVHPETGTTYEWYTRVGTLAVDLPPRPADLAELPEAWVEFLAGDGSGSYPEHHSHEGAATALPGTAVTGQPSVWDTFPRQFTVEEARAFVEPALAALRSAPNGTINNRLNETAVVLGHFVPAFLSRAQAEAALLEALRSTMYDGRTWRAESTIASGLAAGARSWRAEKVESPTHLVDRGSQSNPPADTVPEDPRARVVDLGPFLDGTFVAPEPSVGGERDDTRRLLYPGRWHTVVGLTAAGKSWLALWHAKDAMQAGSTVAYAHFEEALPTGTIARLRAMACPDEVIRERFVWLDCARRWTRAEFAAALEVVGTPGFVVLDGINAACAMHGWPVDKPEAIGAYRATFVAPAVALGAAVLSLGHPPKARDRQDERHGFGSTAWLDEVDGAAFRLVAAPRSPVRRGHDGAAWLYTVKDRYGEVERHGQPDEKRDGWYYQGALHVDDARDSGVTVVSLRGPGVARAGEPTPREAAVRDRIRAAIKRLRGAGVGPSMSKIVEWVTGDVNGTRAEVNSMVTLGLLVESAGIRGARVFDLPATPIEDQEEEER